MTHIDVLADKTSGLDQPDFDHQVDSSRIRMDSTLGALRFQEIDVARIRFIADRRDGAATGEEALPLVTPLLDQVYDLRRLLQSLKPRTKSILP